LFAQKSDPVEANVVQSEPAASKEGSWADGAVLDNGKSTKVGPNGNMSGNWQKNPHEKKEQSFQPRPADGNSALANPQNNGGYLKPVPTDVEANKRSKKTKGSNKLYTNTDYGSIQNTVTEDYSSAVINDNVNTQHSLQHVASEEHRSTGYNGNDPNDNTARASAPGNYTERASAPGNYTNRSSAPGTTDGHSTMNANDYVEVGTTQPAGHDNDEVVTENQQDKDVNDDVAIVFEGKTYNKRVYDVVLGQYVYTVE